MCVQNLLWDIYTVIPIVHLRCSTPCVTFPVEQACFVRIHFYVKPCHDLYHTEGSEDLLVPVMLLFKSPNSGDLEEEGGREGVEVELFQAPKLALGPGNLALLRGKFHFHFQLPLF